MTSPQVQHKKSRSSLSLDRPTLWYLWGMLFCLVCWICNSLVHCRHGGHQMAPFLAGCSMLLSTDHNGRLGQRVYRFDSFEATLIRLGKSRCPSLCGLLFKLMLGLVFRVEHVQYSIPVSSASGTLNQETMQRPTKRQLFRGKRPRELSSWQKSLLATCQS